MTWRQKHLNALRVALPVTSQRQAIVAEFLLRNAAVRPKEYCKQRPENFRKKFAWRGGPNSKEVPVSRHAIAMRVT